MQDITHIKTDKPAHLRAATQRVTCVALLLAMLASGAAYGADDAKTISDARSAIEEWVEVRKTISKEKRDLALAKEVLQERISIVKREIEKLRQNITDAEKSISDADSTRAKLDAKNAKLKEASSALSATVVSLETRTRKLLTRLANPIRDRVKPLSQRLPDDPKKTESTLSQRFQNVVGILNEVNKFHREITMTSEVQDLPDGSKAEVTAMYVGVSSGYFVGGKGKIGGVGKATADGWVWQPANESAPQIAKAIAILKNEQPASFVQLPLEID